MVLKLQQNIVEKELKSCTGILFRADLTRHGHPTLFGRNRQIGYTLLGQPSKGLPSRILIFFHNVLLCYQYHIQSQCPRRLTLTTLKKLEAYFALFIFLDFRTVCAKTCIIQSIVQNCNKYLEHYFLLSSINLFSDNYWIDQITILKLQLIFNTK